MKTKLGISIVGSLFSLLSLASPAHALTSYAAAKIIDLGNVVGPPDTQSEFSTNGGHVTAWRAPGVGDYTFSFGGMWQPSLPHTLQFSMPSDSRIVCAPTSEGSVNNDFLVIVRCYSPEGQPTWLGPNAPLSVVYRMDSTTTSEVAGYARSVGSTLHSSWNSRGGTTSVTRTSVGHFSFTFGTLPAADTDGTALVSTRTAFTRCAVANLRKTPVFVWPSIRYNVTVDVVCTAASTTLQSFQDASVSVYYGARPIVPSTSFGWGFAWVDPFAPTPIASSRQKMSNGQAVTFRRFSPGDYAVTFPGLSVDIPFVSTVGNSDTVCSTFHLAQLPNQVSVDCRQNGAAVDSPFIIETVGP